MNGQSKDEMKYKATAGAKQREAKRSNTGCREETKRKKIGLFLYKTQMRHKETEAQG